MLTEASEEGNWCYSRASSLKEADNPNVRLSVFFEKEKKQSPSRKFVRSYNCGSELSLM